jgi:hypothetical protein
MPAPPNCRACGAPLPADVRWCTLCLEPVRELTPRAAVHTGDFVGELHDEPRYTRWRAGPTSFGPVGRIVATVAVILMGPWTGVSMFTILYVPVWIMLSTMILKEVWQRQKIDPDAPPTRMESLRERHPTLGTHINAPLLLAVMGLLLVVVAALTLTGAALFVLVALVACAGVGALLAWFAGM